MNQITLEGITYNLVPVEESKPELLTSIHDVCNELRCQYRIDDSGQIVKFDFYPDDLIGNYSEIAAGKVAAYIQILNLCEYLNGKFEGDDSYSRWVIKKIDFNIISSHESIADAIYHFTSRQSAEYALSHFKPLFEQFYS